MEQLERLQKPSDKGLIDIVRYYKRYNYDKQTREQAINMLIERGFTLEQLHLRGQLSTNNYDEALKQYNALS